VSAWDDLMSFAQDNCPKTQDSFRALIDAALDEHAHKLAERIRQADSEISFGEAFYVGTGMSDAANLIDPEEKK